MSRIFEDFAAEEVTPMLRFATLTCDAHLAQDVVQECPPRAQQKWQRTKAARTWAGPWSGVGTGPYEPGDLPQGDVLGGVAGHLANNEDGQVVSFTWRPDPAARTAVTAHVNRVPDGRVVLERVVRSARPDPTASMPLALLMDSGPHAVRGTPDDWSVEMFDGRWEDKPYTAKLGAHRRTGDPAVVRGVKGVAGEYGLAVQPAPDRLLSVRPANDERGAIPWDQLIAIANDAEVTLYPDMSWLGTR